MGPKQAHNKPDPITWLVVNSSTRYDRSGTKISMLIKKKYIKELVTQK